MLPQVPRIHDTQGHDSDAAAIRPCAGRPSPALVALRPGASSLLAGLFRERRELTKQYAVGLRSADLLQNHLLEAGVRFDTPSEDMHGGWEAPHCQLRGHFAGHWLSAMAHWAAVDQSPVLRGRASEVVHGLERCQKLNLNGWVGSIPEKYFEIMTRGQEPIWSPQYVVHKTLMGLLDASTYLGDEGALAVVLRAADWFVEWSERLEASGRAGAVYGGECAGMLELWANLYDVTNDPKHLQLALRYGMPELFQRLLSGEDPLTNAHANASIPWISGAARLYEVTGDTKYRRVVEQFWLQAVVLRGMFATTGSNAGEFWIPPHQHGRFLGSRTQEHCAVYNMIRVAECLLRWTGKSEYADYIERALHNGILAQQNPKTGLITYFLPLGPGAKKNWRSKRHDFWCCHGTLLQAQAMVEDLIYYRADDGLTVCQFIASQARWSIDGNEIHISQRFDPAGEEANLVAAGDVTHRVVEFVISATEARPWVLRIRQPGWAAGPASVTIDGRTATPAVSENGFLEIRHGFQETRVTVSFPKRLVREPLPGDARRCALLDGPVVLAALEEHEPELRADSVITPMYEHQYIDGRDWQSGHFLVRTRDRSVEVKPLYEIVGERYCVYWANAP